MVPNIRRELVLKPTVHALNLFSSGVRWRAMLRGRDDVNDLVRDSALMQRIEALFEAELGARFSEGQLHLLRVADVALVALEPGTGRVVAYTTTHHFAVGTIPGCHLPVSMGGHCIVARDHQMKGLGSFSSVTGLLLCQPLRGFAKPTIFTVRSGSRAFYRYMSKLGLLYRSDELAQVASTAEGRSVRAVMRHVHRELFLVDSPLPEDRPLAIRHTFTGRLIEGLTASEILYLGSVTSLAQVARKVLSRALLPRRAQLPLTAQEA